MSKLRFLGGEELGKRMLGSGLIFVSDRAVSPGAEQIGENIVVMAHDVIKETKEDLDWDWHPIEGLKEIKASEYHLMKEAQDASA